MKRYGFLLLVVFVLGLASYGHVVADELILDEIWHVSARSAEQLVPALERMNADCGERLNAADTEEIYRWLRREAGIEALFPLLEHAECAIQDQYDGNKMLKFNNWTITVDVKHGNLTITRYY